MAKLPTDSVLVKLFHLGQSDLKIAKTYGVTVSAVRKRYMNMDPPLRRQPDVVRVTELLATIWDIKSDRTGGDTHHNKYAAKNLKVALRVQLGDAVSDKQREDANRFIRRLKRDNHVLDYDRETEEGWKFRPRKPEDGQMIIRWPSGIPLPEEEDLRRALLLPEGDLKGPQSGDAEEAP
ncbi:hypothetical protein AB0I84_07585 [Streptomyces spectabilis]|uniref:hypothetical protein n=1 Tax=Streptomyces spectabilis TaxID=68270 RepID=UPI0033DAEE34